MLLSLLFRFLFQGFVWTMAQFTLLENLIINDEVVQLRSGSYEEVTNCSDQRTVLFKFEKKALSEWKSKSLSSELTTVTGFKQSFSRLYDVDVEAYNFLTVKDDHTLDVEEVLARTSTLWDGKSDLSKMEIVNIINQVIDTCLNDSVEYATTIKKSLFPDDCELDVNLKTMDNGFKHLLEQNIESDGLTHGYTYLGVSLSFFPVHKEDSDLISINYAHFRGGKIWFSVSEDQTHLFLDLLSELYDKSVEGCSKGVIDIKCPAMFRHKMMWINPFLVIARGIRVHVTFQKEGQYIVTPVGIFHWGINICSNVHEAWNVTSMKWSGMMQIIDRSYCICGEVKDPARLRFSGEIVDGVYRAAIVSDIKPTGGFRPVSGSDDVLKHDPSEPATADESQTVVSEKPLPPGAPVADEVRANHAVLCWTPSPTSGVRYSVQQRLRTETRWQDADTKEYISSTLTKVRGLLEHEHYFFRIVAVKGEMVSRPSKQSRVIVAKNPFTVPSQPRDLHYTAHSNLLQWSEPETDGGAPILGYLLSYKFPASDHWLKVRQGGATTACVFNRVLKGFSYRVEAENEDGVSPPSDAVYIPDVIDVIEIKSEPPTSSSSDSDNGPGHESSHGHQLVARPNVTSEGQGRQGGRDILDVLDDMEVLDEAADEDRGRLEKNVQETASTLTGRRRIKRKLCSCCSSPSSDKKRKVEKTSE